MRPTLCTLAGVAAMVTTLTLAPAQATRQAGGELALAVSARPGVIEVELADADGPVPAARASGKAVLTVNGLRLGVALLPAGGNRLAGQAPFRTGDAVAAEVTVTVDGRTAQACYGCQPWPTSFP